MVLLSRRRNELILFLILIECARKWKEHVKICVMLNVQIIFTNSCFETFNVTNSSFLQKIFLPILEFKIISSYNIRI